MRAIDQPHALFPLYKGGAGGFALTKRPHQKTHIMSQYDNNINTDQASKDGCFKSFILIGGSFAVLIIVLFSLKLLFGLN
jgi:hypothetical protein